MKEEITKIDELPQEIIDYYDRQLLESTSDNTWVLRFMEYLKNRDPLYVPEEWDGK